MKFSIRDLFLVTVIVALALALAWGIDRWKLVGDYEYILRFERKKRDEAEAEIISREELKKRFIKREFKAHPDFVEFLKTETDLPNSPAPAPNPPQD